MSQLEGRPASTRRLRGARPIADLPTTTEGRSEQIEEVVCRLERHYDKSSHQHPSVHADSPEKPTQRMHGMSYGRIWFGAMPYLWRDMAEPSRPHPRPLAARADHLPCGQRFLVAVVKRQ